MPESFPLSGEQVGVIGLGLMGHGIGLVSAQGGYDVVAIESKPEALELGKKRIDDSLAKLLSKVRAIEDQYSQCIRKTFWVFNLK